MNAHRTAPELTLLRLEGSDCASFLQGYVTADTELLDDRWQGCAFTNLKGRVVATALLRRRRSESIECVVSTDLAESMQQFLAKYLMFARSELSVVGDQLVTSLGDVDESQRWFAGAGLSVAGEQGLGHTGEPLTELAWHHARLSAGIAWVTAATSEAHLPQMLGLVELGYVSFDKGCYLGQEIVARAAHRGGVKRHLARLTWTGDRLPSAGEDVISGDRRVGSIVDACSGLEPGKRGLALAVIGHEVTGELRSADARWLASLLDG